MPKTEMKIPVHGEWMKSVIKRRGFSLYALGRSVERGGIGKDIRTIRRAVSENKITPQLLDLIARAVNVHPDFLAGKYCWTLELPVMDYEGVRDYWLENYLNPDHFPYILAEQQKLGSYRQLLNTLLMHGVTKEDFLEKSRPDRDKMADQLDLAVTGVLKQWFPSCYRGDAVDYAEAMEWRDERDVYEAMLEYLEERGIVKVDYPGEN